MPSHRLICRPWNRSRWPCPAAARTCSGMVGCAAIPDAEAIDKWRLTAHLGAAGIAVPGSWDDVDAVPRTPDHCSVSAATRRRGRDDALREQRPRRWPGGRIWVRARPTWCRSSATHRPWRWRAWRPTGTRYRRWPTESDQSTPTVQLRLRHHRGGGTGGDGRCRAGAPNCSGVRGPFALDLVPDAWDGGRSWTSTCGSGAVGRPARPLAWTSSAADLAALGLGPQPKPTTARAGAQVPLLHAAARRLDTRAAHALAAPRPPPDQTVVGLGGQRLGRL